MPVYHIGNSHSSTRLNLSTPPDTPLVLFKLKPGVSAAQLSEWKAVAAAMVGKIPGDPFLNSALTAYAHLSTILPNPSVSRL